MSSPDIRQAIDDRDRYFIAMLRNQTHVCTQIEQCYGLYGYPPEIVSIGLNAACAGKDPEQAADNYVNRKRS